MTAAQCESRIVAGPTRALAPIKPATPVPGSKAIHAKQLLAQGKSLAEVSAETGIPKDLIDREMWRLLGLRLEPRA